MSTLSQVPVSTFGGPTALLDYGGLRVLTDPTFDEPGAYHLPGGPVLTKTEPSRTTSADVGPIDIVLLSHDGHVDNLDTSGRELLPHAALTLTTPSGGKRLSAALGTKAKGLADWQSVDVDRPDGGTITVTGVPALHGVGARADVEARMGEVVGFVLTGQGLPSVYVSGDNASLEAVREIADRFGPIDTAVLFAGAPRPWGELIVLDSAGAAEAAQILGARRVVPVHYDSWEHLTEGRAELTAAFSAAGLADRLDWGQAT
ncbi:MBL fold metallo-hydrolase [Streptomyces liangshanensis]|uniref:MBL fold metallo-hydrolase n=1 Tax=Streptomyces liangshanensis TaxID=2717324 RepID=UPI0036D89C3D